MGYTDEQLWSRGCIVVSIYVVYVVLIQNLLITCSLGTILLRLFGVCSVASLSILLIALLFIPFLIYAISIGVPRSKTFLLLVLQISIGSFSIVETKSGLITKVFLFKLP